MNPGATTSRTPTATPANEAATPAADGTPEATPPGAASPGAASAGGQGLTFARVLALARPQWRALALGTVFLVVGSAAGLVFPQLARGILDGALESGDRATVDRTAALLMLAFVVQGIAVTLRYWLFTQAGERIVVDLRRRLYEAVLAQEIAFFDERRTGELLSRLSADAAVLQNAVSVNISMALRNVVMAVGGLALLLWTSWELGLIMLAVVPPVVLGSVVFGRYVRRIAREAQDQLAVAGEVAEETLSGVRTVRSFTREPEESRRYGSAVEGYFAVARRQIRLVAWFMGAMSIAGYGAIAVVLWAGGRRVVDGAMSVGDLTQFILYTLLVAASVAVLGNLYADFVKARGASQRVFELLDRVPAIRLRGGARPADCAGRVELEDVVFAYPGRPDAPVLRGLSLVAEPGERVAIVGASGAGKSTLAALLRRFYDVDAGAVRVDGHDVRELDPEWLRTHVGIVDQEPMLMSTTIAENIRYGRPDASDDEVRRCAADANAAEFIERFPDGWATMVGERGVQLSGGQKQRVAIARALLRDPAILILDEATSALDADSEHVVQQALERLMVGRTTLVIAHRLSTIRTADRIVVLDNGQVRESGTWDQLIAADGTFTRLVARQATP